MNCMSGDTPIREGEVVYFIHINNMIERVRPEIMPPAPVIAEGRDFLVIHSERDISSFSADRDFLIPREHCARTREELEARYPSLIVYVFNKGDAVGYMKDGDPRHGIVVDRGGDGGYHYRYAWLDILDDSGSISRVPRNSAWLIQEAGVEGA